MTRQTKKEAVERTGWRALWPTARQYPWRVVLVGVVALSLALAGGYLALRPTWAFREHRHRGEQALEDGDYSRAVAELSRCLTWRPGDGDTHLLLARAQRLAGNHADAARHVRAARDRGADAQRVALELMLIDATAGKLDQVEKTLQQQIVAGHPDRRHLREALLRGLLARQRAEEAERLATAWITEAPDDWQPWLLRGLARSQLSRDLLSTAFDQAKKDYQRVLELKPDHAMARFLLGNAHGMSGQFQEALPHLEHYCRLKPDDWAGIRELAGCHRTLGQVEEARRLLDAWLAQHPGTAEVYLLRGQVALDLGKPEEALAHGQRAEALAPGNEKTVFHLARALRALGRAKEAAEYEEKWRSWQTLSTRLEELKQVAAREPRNVAVRHEAGTIALRLGDEPAGLRWLANVLQLDPGHRATHAILADHFQRKGNQEAAMFHRRLAEARSP